MTVFIDTSAIFALIDVDDDRHAAADQAFRFLVNGESLVSHNYVIVESIALIQRRLGLDAVRDVVDRLLPLLEVRWLDADAHGAATDLLLASGRQRTSLVDWASFALMRRERIDTAFAFDRDFAAQGFSLIPPQPSAREASSR